MRAVVALAALAACGDNTETGPWLRDAGILVPGVGVTEADCRTRVCPHNENTDLVAYDGAIYFVHRTANSQVLGPNSSLRVYRAPPSGAPFEPLAIIPAPTAATFPALGDRDLRDPHFYVAGGQLAIKALTRLPVTSIRDTDVDTIAVVTRSADGGRTWSPLAPIGPPTWSFWRIRDRAGVLYAAAYEDGDRSIRLFSSVDGLAWTPGAVIYDVASDTPLEPELVFLPSGRLLVLIRLDGTDDELLGSQGRLRTKVCWALPPYDVFACPQDLTGVRLDGSVAFWYGERLLVIARKHIVDYANRKRTALYEIGGELEGGPLTITERGELPSAGDTAYAGVVELDRHRVLATWYSSDIAPDPPWLLAVLEPSDIWVATIDMSRL